MRGDLGKLMKQAQKMQDEMQKAQQEAAKLEVQGEAGGGLVKLTMTCGHEVKAIEIADSLLADDRDMLEDILIAAFNDAHRKAEATMQEKYSGLAGGLAGELGLPPGIKLPF